MSAEEKKLESFTYTLRRTDAGGRWKGRTVRIFKRRSRAYWYCEPGFGGQQYKKCLESEARETVVLMAIEHCDAIWSGRVPVAKVVPSSKFEIRSSKFATIGEVLEAYEKVAVPAYQRERTAATNANALRLVVREVLLEQRIRRNSTMVEREQARVAVDGVSTELLEGSVWTRFEHGRLSKIAQEDRLARKSAMESINTYATAARSVFQGQFLELYRTLYHLKLPDGTKGTQATDGLHGFLTVSLAQPKREPKAKPPRELLVKTFAAANTLAWVEPEVYIAFVLAGHSLRRAEIMRCEKSWIREEEMEDDTDFTIAGEKQWVIRTDLGKSDRSRQIPIAEWVAQELLNYWETSLCRRPLEEHKYLLPRGCGYPGVKAREDGVVRRLSQWMRGLGWVQADGHRKTLHELRAWFLRKARAQYGRADELALEATARMAGHQDKRTTENNYTGEVSMRGKVVQFPVLAHGHSAQGVEMPDVLATEEGKKVSG